MDNMHARMLLGNKDFPVLDWEEEECVHIRFRSMATRSIYYVSVGTLCTGGGAVHLTDTDL